MRHEHGGRVVMDLERVGADAAAYRVVLHEPERAFQGVVEVVLADGTVTFSAWTPPDAPAWLVDLARAFLRAAWNTRRRPDAPPWPRRINRWRRSRG